MLKELIAEAVEEMQADCKKLIQQHYPTVHGQGILPHHLTSIFERRIALLMKERNLEWQTSGIFLDLDQEQDRRGNPFCKISTLHGNIWVIAVSIKSNNTIFRQQLLFNLAKWRKQYATCIKKEDRLLLIGDHWLSRNSGSQQLLDWWLNNLPNNQVDYKQIGLHLTRSRLTKLDSTLSPLRLMSCYKQHSHPLVNPDSVSRYLHLYALYKPQ